MPLIFVNRCEHRRVIFHERGLCSPAKQIQPVSTTLCCHSNAEISSSNLFPSPTPVTLSVCGSGIPSSGRSRPSFRKFDERLLRAHRQRLVGNGGCCLRGRLRIIVLRSAFTTSLRLAPFIHILLVVRIIVGTFEEPVAPRSRVPSEYFRPSGELTGMATLSGSTGSSGRHEF